MAFMKTSIAYQKPRIATPKVDLKVGDKKDGMVWDGENWISEKDWEKKSASSREVSDG